MNARKLVSRLGGDNMGRCRQRRRMEKGGWDFYFSYKSKVANLTVRAIKKTGHDVR